MENLGHTFIFRLFWNDIILTAEPENIKAILASDFSSFEKGPVSHERMLSVLGSGVFNSDGEMWKFHRGMSRPFFSRERVSHFNLFDRYTEEVLNLMKLRLREGYAINFQDLVSRFTLDSASDFLFGHCVNSLSADLPYPYNVVQSRGVAVHKSDAFACAFAKAQNAIMTRAIVGEIWPLLEIFEDKCENAMKIVHAYLEPILQEALRKAKDSPTREKDEIDEDETLLDQLVKYTLDPVVLRDEILNILIAGRDTTAATLTFIVYLLAMHPCVFARLREEILTRVGPNRQPTYEDIKEMKFLRAVINETLRLFPPVPFNERTSVNDTTFSSPDPSGKPFYIPKGTRCCYSVFIMHRRKDLWGPDAEEFDPDRFLDERAKKFLTPRPFIFLPFNAGPRICLGQQFAYNEISFFLIRLLQNIDSIALAPESQPPYSKVPERWKQEKGRSAIEQVRLKTRLTMYSSGGMWVRMTEASA